MEGERQLNIKNSKIKSDAPAPKNRVSTRIWGWETKHLRRNRVCRPRARVLFKMDKGRKKGACVVGHSQETQLLAIVRQSRLGG
ncbi:hypothetical protein D0A34_09935 [Microcoleus vaginatus PCC 9802]|nr:hypothetical protein D0A34_09935 [Microcoleus vaginatus PCC 9802]